MRRKYKYFVSGEEMSKKEFVNKLKLCCQKVVHTSYVGYIGVDLCELDKKEFNEAMRDINDGIKVIYPGGMFYRKAVI